MFPLQHLFAKLKFSQNAGDDWTQGHLFRKWWMLRLGVLSLSSAIIMSKMTFLWIPFPASIGFVRVNPNFHGSTSRTSFASFYLQQHRGRSLRWCPAWGQCLLRANYCGGRKELVVSHFQAWKVGGACRDVWIGLNFSEVKGISKRMFAMAYECI